VRTRLYILKSGWKSESGAWRTAEKLKLVTTVSTALAGGYSAAAKQKLVRLDRRLQMPDDWAERFDKRTLKAVDIERTPYEVDHFPVPLAEHWVNSGHDQGDDQRRGHNVDKSNWRLITRRWNRSLQAGGYQFGQKPEVGTSFTSELADGGIPNAKRIDGRPFRDDKGNPIA
jgi:hypothetical protein